jgi:NAD(P) transhydrogenase subunit alpha
MVPEVASRLITAGHTVRIEAGSGAHAFFADASYVERGAEIAPDLTSLLDGAQVLCTVAPPLRTTVDVMEPGTALVGFFAPATNLELLAALTERHITVFSLDLLPRISRAQSMDALSSQATVSGYRAALIAADRLAKFFPMFMTAAGTVPPAKVLVLGAGVAGLQAIATARRLGAVVRAHDVRPSSKDEVKSLGATFVELPLESQTGEGGYARAQSEEFLARQREMIGNEVAAADVVITTAAVPGRAAPLLVTAAMVEAMRPGSVIVDLAAETGGNCELSEAGKDVVHQGVTVFGALNLPSSMATHASFLYSRNIAEFVGLLAKGADFAPDFDDEIVSGTCLSRDGQVRHEPTLQLLGERHP